MTELIWEGKYDQHGRRVAPLRVALPFQTVETVNESAQERQHTLDLFSTGHDPEWRNRLIWGDKKYVLPALLQEFTGNVDLVYIEPQPMRMMGRAVGSHLRLMAKKSRLTRSPPLSRRRRIETLGDGAPTPGYAGFTRRPH